MATARLQRTAPVPSSSAYSVPPLPAPPTYTVPSTAVGGEENEYWSSLTDHCSAPVSAARADTRPS